MKQKPVLPDNDNNNKYTKMFFHESNNDRRYAVHNFDNNEQVKYARTQNKTIRLQQT